MLKCKRFKRCDIDHMEMVEREILSRPALKITLIAMSTIGPCVKDFLRSISVIVMVN